MKPVDPFCAHSCQTKFLPHHGRPRLASHHADIVGFFLCDLQQTFLIVSMASCHNHIGRIRLLSQIPNRLVKGAADDLLSAGLFGTVGKVLPILQKNRMDPRKNRKLCKGGSDIACSADHHPIFLSHCLQKQHLSRSSFSQRGPPRPCLFCKITDFFFHSLIIRTYNRILAFFLLPNPSSDLLFPIKQTDNQPALLFI